MNQGPRNPSNNPTQPGNEKQDRKPGDQGGTDTESPTRDVDGKHSQKK